LSREGYRSAIRLKRNRSSLQNSDELKPFAAPAQRQIARVHAINKVLTNRSQRLFLMNVGDVTVPLVIRVLKLGKGIVVRRALHSNVIDFDLFVGLQVVVDDHSARPNNSHLANLSRLEPTALDRGKTLVPKIQRHIGHVLDVRGHMSIPLTIHRDRELPENMENDRDVVR